MFLNLLISAIFPPKCLSCRAFFTPYPQQIGSEAIILPELCSECQKALLPVSSPRSEIFGKVHAAGAYSVLKPLIHAFKYEDKTQLADSFGEILFAAFLRYWQLSEIDMIAPVPLYIARLKERGFNQALLMLRNWYKRFREIGTIPIPIEPELLVRIRATKQQVGLGAEERKINLKDAFRVLHSEKIREKTVLLIDDVYTTGTTVSECAKVLLYNGAKRVDVLTLAKAVLHEA